jgi:hypothetical protein
MAITGTTLAAAIDANALTFNATSATGATVGGFAKIDQEFMVITAIDGTKISVRSRGDNGSTAVAHDILAALTFGLNSDLSSLPMYSTIPVDSDGEGLIYIGQNTASLAVPNRDTTFVINKATALGSTTLANPSKSQDGLELQFVSNTDAAHVVTLVTSQDGTTGNHTTYTFAAFGGAGFRIKAVGGRWLTLASVAVTIT